MTRFHVCISQSRVDSEDRLPTEDDETDLPRAAEDVDNVIQDLYQVMVQVASYDQAGRPSKEILADQMCVAKSHDAPKLSPSLPPSPNPASAARSS